MLIGVRHFADKDKVVWGGGKKDDGHYINH